MAKLKYVEKRYRTYACWKPNNEADNPMPTTPHKVVDVKELPAGDLTVLVLEDKDGERTECTLYPRDWNECQKEWGKDTDTADWGYVHFVEKKGIKRALLVPCDPQPVNVEDI